MRVYEPTIVDGEQRFVANLIAIPRGLIAFADLLPEKGKAIKFGTLIHSLLIHTDCDPVMFELNDQGNTRYASEIERIELTPTRLRIVFVAGAGPYSGRVSLSPEIEIFDHDPHEPKQLRSLVVEMKPTTTQLARISQRLASNMLIRHALAPASVARRKPATKAPVRAGGLKRRARTKRKPAT